MRGGQWSSGFNSKGVVMAGEFHINKTFPAGTNLPAKCKFIGCTFIAQCYIGPESVFDDCIFIDGIGLAQSYVDGGSVINGGSATNVTFEATCIVNGVTKGPRAVFPDNVDTKGQDAPKPADGVVGTHTEKDQYIGFAGVVTAIQYCKNCGSIGVIGEGAEFAGPTVVK